MTRSGLAPEGRQPRFGGWAMVVALLSTVTLAGFWLHPHVSVASQAMMYVLAVVVASYRFAWMPSFFCAIASVILLNFFFISPRFTFHVDAQENLVALATMLAVALVISRLGAAVRRETESAQLNERRARELQQLATELADAQTDREVHSSGMTALVGAFHRPCAVGLLTESGDLDLMGASATLHCEDMLYCIREAAPLGPGTGRRPELNAWYVPLGDKGQTAGAACIENVRSEDRSGREHAEALCTLLGQALWRLRLTDSMRAAQQESQRHLVQNTLLAAISHDLRTPLAAIVGSASSLQMQSDKLAPDERERLLSSILSESDYLTRLTENTLQLARLASSAGLNLDWVSMEEVVGAVLARVRQRDPSRRIKSNVPVGLPLIRADAVLLTQLVENLLDNALKYSSETIDLTVTGFQDEMQLAVHDCGSGIPEKEELAIFEPYRRGDRAGQRGSGLGLAVCKAIANAHGGTLCVKRREGGGSSFIAALPVAQHQPEPV